VTAPDLLGRVDAWIAAHPVRAAFLGLATTVFLIELALRQFAAKSRAYARWKHFFESIGELWSAVFLSIIYVTSVGILNAFMRLRGRDLLDRALGTEPSTWRPHEPNPLGPQAGARHQF
jgi:hypothetical protein